MPDKFIITIDGPSASGKGTLAARLADKLKYIHLDTGALYRAVACEVLKSDGDPEDEEQAARAAKKITEDLAEILDPQDRSRSPSAYLRRPELREEKVSQAASKVAAHQCVRDILLHLQTSFAENAPCGAVLDGRDTGTVICPDADLKLFVTASTEERAKRRLKELQSRGIDVTYEAVLKDMRERDRRDMGRENAPLEPAPDAIELDTTNLNQDQAFEKALEIVGDSLKGH